MEAVQDTSIQTPTQTPTLHQSKPRTGDGLALAHRQRVLQVKHGLLPVRVAAAGTGAEADGLVAAAELDVEVANQRVDEVIAAGRKLEGRLLSEVHNVDSEGNFVCSCSHMSGSALCVPSYAVE